MGVAMMLIICVGDTIWYGGQEESLRGVVPVVTIYPNLVYSAMEFTMIVCPVALLAGLGADLRHHTVYLVKATSVAAVRYGTKCQLQGLGRT